MSLEFRIIDAFTSTPFAGNPAAVVLVPANHPRRDDTDFLLSVAREFNQPMTAFLTAKEGGDEPKYAIRWFTGIQEYPLCGHASLAAAALCFTELNPTARHVRLEAAACTLTADKLNDGSIEIALPQDLSVFEDAPVPPEAKAAVKAANAALFDAVIEMRKIKIGWLVVLDSTFDLEHAEINYVALQSCLGSYAFTQARLTPSAVGEAIFSRVYHPFSSTPEDFVCGAAHCSMVPYWLSQPASTRLPPTQNGWTHSTPFKSLQGGPRQGVLAVRWDKEAGLVALAGSARIVMKGEVLV
ncbi:hypothetical protein NBRC10513v2_002787 [Rhodotorula toruloides]|uniref:Phenazine biosynthesis PhzC/PhzF family protein n=1 Tax=Rhodotorula toruloides TaxID=5286 RepID=A0A2T0AA76_RHOTO|nr:hypothetical protein AAT19DRAFT_13933 [Rhodotorula toruloides]